MWLIYCCRVSEMMRKWASFAPSFCGSVDECSLLIRWHSTPLPASHLSTRAIEQWHNAHWVWHNPGLQSHWLRQTICSLPLCVPLTACFVLGPGRHVLASYMTRIYSTLLMSGTCLHFHKLTLKHMFDYSTKHSFLNLCDTNVLLKTTVLFFSMLLTDTL